MQVAKYWRNRKLRYRLEGLARPDARVVLPQQAEKDAAARNGRLPRKREPVRMSQ